MATTRLPNDPESGGEIRPDPTLARTPPTRQWCPVTAPRPPPRRHLRVRGSGGTTVAAAEGARRAGSYSDGSQNPVFDAAAHWYHTGRQEDDGGAGSADESGGRPGPVAGAAASGRVAASQRRPRSAGPPPPPPEESEQWGKKEEAYDFSKRGLGFILYYVNYRPLFHVILYLRFALNLNSFVRAGWTLCGTASSLSGQTCHSVTRSTWKMWTLPPCSKGTVWADGLIGPCAPHQKVGVDC